MSGYAQSVSPESSEFSGLEFIQKPFTPDALLRLVCKLLGKRSAEHSRT
jgi:hypothetical protein